MSRSATAISPWYAVAAMTAFGAVALLVGVVFGAITYTLVGGPLSIAPDGAAGQVLTNVGTYAAVGAMGVVYLFRYDLPLSYVRYRRPDVRDLAAVVVTILVLLALAVAIPWVVDRLGLPIVEHSIAGTIEGDPSIALAFLPVSILVVGPAEEFIYRGIVQTRLRERFEAGSAVGIAAVIFASVHFLAYLDPTNVPGTVVTIAFVLLPLGAVLGAVYERTENLIVPALAHGFYNAITFGLTYAEVVGLF
ncbi:CPBP family intramembrane metalloprotease [Natronomonas sp. F2-12]|jgi:membrane protease YdiL (CAAX protease family)|uniref:CPBP family intramembrane metalloprotease n=1 Tax=Natronomonas aquatica TaxID=2841590 RepID=A0A9R1CS39_9EURY|nr:type II CAAX endopeptidase family protein [Natronomonas aquatica]MCQ4332679.1 CPBP family intramembrane metalloprotease [Natronomonas aquatica]